MREIQPFHGGLKLVTHKEQTNTRAIRQVGIPDQLVLRLRSPIGTRANPLVAVGDYVRKGQPLAEPGTFVSMWVHAPTSGTIVAIAEHAVPHPSGLTLPCISIEPDGEDLAVEAEPITDYTQVSPQQLTTRIHQAGIVGMGGAGFPSHVKVREGLNNQVDTLIINGVECEPYITCDDRLMRERADQVVAGARILKYCVQAEHCVIAIEADMPEALASVQAAVGGDEDIEVVAVPALYPQGGEKQLIQALTGREVPSRGLPIHLGMLVHNVATVVAIYRAIVLGLPLTSRIITVAGEIAEPGNYEVLIGTPMEFLLKQCGWTDTDAYQVLMGGPMMGLVLDSPQLPIIKVSNCLLVQKKPQPENPVPCIRCGECVEVCPVSLLPQDLYSFIRARDYDRVQDYNIFDCIECGCCDHVCPSRIPLVHYYRFAKSEINALDVEQRKSAEARGRFQQRTQRLQQLKVDKQQRRQEKLSTRSARGKVVKSDKKAEIQAAIQRTREKRERQKNKPESDG